MNSTVIALLFMACLSTCVGWFFVHTKEVEKPVKIMLFVLYFWLSAFIQLMAFSLLYKVGLLEFIK